MTSQTKMDDFLRTIRSYLIDEDMGGIIRSIKFENDREDGEFYVEIRFTNFEKDFE